MISGYLIGADQLVAKLNAMPDRVKTSLDDIVQKLGFALQQRVQEQYLRGPRPTHLGVLTGRLLNSITQGRADSRSRFESTATSAFAYVGSNVEYAAAWEYGFKGQVAVKQHTRELRTQGTWHVKGAKKHGGIGEWVKKRGDLTGATALVGFFHFDFRSRTGEGYFLRNVNMVARPFLAPALEDMRSLIVEQMKAALQKTAVEALK